MQCTWGTLETNLLTTAAACWLWSLLRSIWSLLTKHMSKPSTKHMQCTWGTLETNLLTTAAACWLWSLLRSIWSLLTKHMSKPSTKHMQCTWGTLETNLLTTAAACWLWSLLRSIWSLLTKHMSKPSTKHMQCTWGTLETNLLTTAAACWLWSLLRSIWSLLTKHMSKPSTKHMQCTWGTLETNLLTTAAACWLWSLLRGTGNSFSHIDFLKICAEPGARGSHQGHITPRLHCVYRSKRSEHMNAKHCLSLAENDPGGLQESTVQCAVPMRFMFTSLSWFVLEATNVTHAENCDDLCLSVEGCPTRFKPNPHGPAYATYLHDLEHQGHSNLPFTLCLQVQTKRAHECETLPTIQEGSKRNYSSYAVYVYFSFMICARRKTCDTRWELRRSMSFVKGCPRGLAKPPWPCARHVFTRFGTSRSHQRIVYIAFACPSETSTWMQNIALPLQKTIQGHITPHLHCVYRSKRSEHIHAKHCQHCLTLTENDLWPLKNIRFLCGLHLLLYRDLC